MKKLSCVSKTGKGFFFSGRYCNRGTCGKSTLQKKLKPVDGEAETERETRVDRQKVNGEISGFTVTPSPPWLVIFPMTVGTWGGLRSNTVGILPTLPGNSNPGISFRLVILQGHNPNFCGANKCFLILIVKVKTQCLLGYFIYAINTSFNAV